MKKLFLLAYVFCVWEEVETNLKISDDQYYSILKTDQVRNSDDVFKSNDERGE